MTKRTTIGDVAKRAGVGKVTVSYVLNGQAETARISRETAERVMEAARELDYQPNGLARAFVRQKSDAIGVVFQYGNHFASNTAFVTEVMRGVCEGCNECDLDLVLHTRKTSGGQAEADSLTDGRVDGLLVLRDEGDPVLKSIIDRRVPLVLFFSRSSDTSVSWIDSDNFSGGRMAVSHLAGLGHTKIAMMLGSKASVASHDRHMGFKVAMEERGLHVRPEWAFEYGGMGQDAKDLVAMMSRKDRPTALVSWSDDAAFAAMRVLSELGLSVPGDVSVIGFDSTEACERVIPPLTSIRQPIEHIARSATVLLSKIIKKEPIEQRQTIFPLQLDVRGSTSEPKRSGS